MEANSSGAVEVEEASGERGEASGEDIWALKNGVRRASTKSWWGPASASGDLAAGPAAEEV
jgi:hypothetical protein